MVEELLLFRQSFPLRPCGHELLRAFDRSPFILGHDGEEVSFADNLDDAGDAADGLFVDAFKTSADGGRPHDAPMQHIGDAEILHVSEGARDLCRNVEAGYRRTNQLEIFGVFCFWRRLVVDCEREGLAADQIAEAHALAAAADDSVADRHVVRRDAELCMSEFKKRVARGRGRISDLCAANLDGKASPCRSLIGRQGSIALNDGHGCEGRIEFIRCDLGQGRSHARAKIDLAGVNGDHAFCINGEECVDLVQRKRLARCRRGLRK